MGTGGSLLPVKAATAWSWPITYI